jgi:hypothetical protein
VNFGGSEILLYFCTVFIFFHEAQTLMSRNATSRFYTLRKARFDVAKHNVKL